MEFSLCKAQFVDLSSCWEIIQQAIQQRKEDGSEQWQNGYPNEQTLKDDIEKGIAYVVKQDEEIIAYAAIIFAVEPAYESLQGTWLSNGNYVVVHRVATRKNLTKKGIATHLFLQIEQLALTNEVHSIKVDTNFDNLPMLHILKKLGYTYCGEVIYNGAPRKAFEKLLA